MRLFTGLDLPAEVAANLRRLIDQLRPTARLNWSPPANLHVTTKFIGEWPDARLDDLKRALGALPSRPPIEVGIRKVGFFPNDRAPRNFWAGIEAPGLAELARDTDRAATKLGIPSEARAFSPHLTLARIKPPVSGHLDLGPLHARIAALESLEFGKFRAEVFYLYLSRLSPSGSSYSKLAEFPLLKS